MSISDRVSEKQPKIVHVFDTCIWIDLIRGRTDFLDTVCELVRLGELAIGITPTVQMELAADAPRRLEDRKQRWLKIAKDFEDIAKDLGSDAAVESEYGALDRHLQAVSDVRKTIGQYEGGFSEEAVIQAISDPNIVKIPEPKAIQDRLIEFALQNKRPFARNKNSMADARILLATSRWAQRNQDKIVYFYTSNVNDFSDTSDKRTPHSDIVELFAPSTNMEFYTNLRPLAELLKNVDIFDLYPRDPDGCSICNEKVCIDSVFCYACGAYPTGAPDHEEYELTSYRDRYLVDVYDECGGNYRLKCQQCGRKSFEVYLQSLCSYHNYTADRH